LYYEPTESIVSSDVFGVRAYDAAGNLSAEAQARMSELASISAQPDSVRTAAVSDGQSIVPSASLSVRVPGILQRTLYFGVTGDDVAHLQSFLARSPLLYPEGMVTGYYGEYTARAVKRYQCAQNIVCSGEEVDGYGVLGPITRKHVSGFKRAQVQNTKQKKVANAQSAVCPVITQTLALGSRTNEVVVLKKFLAQSGVLSGVVYTNYFGTVTEKALQVWQKKSNIEPTGSTDTMTRIQLLNCK
jgi:peptidoglycan hydrolase-like protein with peptidoglycan-binding domain